MRCRCKARSSCASLLIRLQDVAKLTIASGVTDSSIWRSNSFDKSSRIAIFDYELGRFDGVGDEVARGRWMVMRCNSPGEAHRGGAAQRGTAGHWPIELSTPGFASPVQPLMLHQEISPPDNQSACLSVRAGLLGGLNTRTVIAQWRQRPSYPLFSWFLRKALNKYLLASDSWTVMQVNRSRNLPLVFSGFRPFHFPPSKGIPVCAQKFGIFSTLYYYAESFRTLYALSEGLYSDGGE